MNGTVRLYGKEIKSATNFCIADNVEAEVEVPFGSGLAGSTIKFSIRFLEAGDAKPGSSDWVNADGVVRFTFRGWTASAGAFGEPFRIGDVDGVGLYVQMSQQRIGAVNLVNWYVLVGGA
jgi:hypothetical protein